MLDVRRTNIEQCLLRCFLTYVKKIQDKIGGRVGYRREPPVEDVGWWSRVVGLKKKKRAKDTTRTPASWATLRGSQQAYDRCLTVRPRKENDEQHYLYKQTWYMYDGR